MTERKSRFASLAKVSQRSAEQVRERLVQLILPFLDKLQTMSGDNGKEFAQHEQLAVELDPDFFFAHPYATWDRGSNENMNGLRR